MNECWINVYKSTSSNLSEVIGYYHDCKEDAVMQIMQQIKNRRKYRLHVKLKDKPGLSRSYPYNFKYLAASSWSDGRLSYYNPPITKRRNYLKVQMIDWIR